MRRICFNHFLYVFYWVLEHFLFCTATQLTKKVEVENVLLNEFVTRVKKKIEREERMKVQKPQFWILFEQRN